MKHVHIALIVATGCLSACKGNDKPEPAPLPSKPAIKIISPTTGSVSRKDGVVNIKVSISCADSFTAVYNLGTCDDTGRMLSLAYISDNVRYGPGATQLNDSWVCTVTGSSSMLFIIRGKNLKTGELLTDQVLFKNDN